MGKVVTVFGANDVVEGDAAYEAAEAVGRVLAGFGHAVANGGYGGTMEASARGAKAAGGKTIGVTCSVWRSRPNRFLDEVVRARTLLERLEKLIEIGEAGYVVLPGATGTLAELSLLWELTCKGLMPRRPIVCLGEFWRPLVELMASARPGGQEFVSLVASRNDLSRHFG